MAIEWSGDEEGDIDDGTYDLCGKLDGKYVDVVSSFDGTWSVMWDNERVRQGITTRDEAKAWAEETLTPGYRPQRPAW